MRVLVVVLGLAALVTGALAAQTPTGTQRLVVILSDLHMGVGKDASGAWHPAEDFRWASEFGRFIEAVDDAGHGATDLILNGDTFELWQSTESDCRQPDLGLGCSETEALARVERVLAAHRQEITTLATFGRAGSNRVVVVPGDHDAALLLPAVARRVEEALGGSVSRVEVATQGYWASADGQLYAEHGHQLPHRATRLSAWPRPFVERDGQTFLERSWGEQTVAVFFDERETRYPIIDNLADEGAGLVYGLAADGISDAGDRAPLLLRYVLFRMPWSQFRVDLDAGDVRPPAWDLSAVRAVGPAFLTESLPDDHLFKPIATTALDGGQLADMMAAMTDEELTAVCDYRAATRRSRRRFERILTQFDPQGPPGAECPRLPGTRGGAFDYFWRTRDRIFASQLEEAQARLSATARSIAVFVHGHTHLVDWRQRVLELTSQGRTVIVDGFSPVPNALRPVVVNGGAWQRTITPVQLERLTQTEGVSAAALLASLQPEQLSPCYSFVWIAPYDDTPALPEVRYWRESESGSWEMAGSCGRAPMVSGQSSGYHDVDDGTPAQSRWSRALAP